MTQLERRGDFTLMCIAAGLDLGAGPTIPIIRGGRGDAVAYGAVEGTVHGTFCFAPPFLGHNRTRGDSR
jgi:hypothetical protein